ncbi:hypothetical protein Cgig2_022272 [Carnegiea gigantea]|uniref:NAC domain-containing protein n=1 Tax=Carnegiea gigantea TaxID=171969 RepID=A0A9Q1QIL9_9CARY|nr:hypothetical protein Cgig2_022272 [Carnegiea gigantea]
MREKMNISVNGQSRVPPGFRFHPTEEELLQYYLRKKVANEKIDLDVIFEVDLNKLEPWDIQERCKIGSTPQNDWYFFSHKDKKYPTGTRTNRATAAGFWKATGRDKVIYSNSKRIGMRKTLVFYKGRAPHGHKSDWIMHEYRLYDGSFNVANNDAHFMKLPSLESPNNSIQVQAPNTTYQQPLHHDNDVVVADSVFNSDSGGLCTDWAALDRFIATHLNGQPAEMMTLASIFSSSLPYDHPDEHDHDHIELPPLRASPSTSSGIIEMYQPAATVDDYGGNEIDL